MSLANMKIGARLGVGFGVVMVLMVALIVVSLIRLANISDISDRIINKDWVKADTAQTINVLIRANARRTMELFITSDNDKVNQIYQSISTNKKTIDEALGALDKLVYDPEGKALLVEITESRTAYVTSFSKVADLLKEEKRDEAVSTMNGETI